MSVTRGGAVVARGRMERKRQGDGEREYKEEEAGGKGESECGKGWKGNEAGAGEEREQTTSPKDEPNFR